MYRDIFLPFAFFLFAFILHIYCVFTIMKRGVVACDTYLAMALFDILLLFGSWAEFFFYDLYAHFPLFSLS
jgi:hypothetical protein